MLKCHPKTPQSKISESQCLLDMPSKQVRIASNLPARPEHDRDDRKTNTPKNTNPFTHKDFYTQHFYTDALVHTNIFTHKHLCTETLVHINLFAYEKIGILHTITYTHQHLYTETLVHTNPFTHKDFYTQKVLHTTLLHRCTYTHKHF